MGNTFTSDPALRRNPNRQEQNQRPPRRPLSQNPSTNNTEPTSTERVNPQRRLDQSIGSNDQKLQNISDPQVQANSQFSRMPPPPPYGQIFNQNNIPQQPLQVVDNQALVQNIPTAPPVKTDSQAQQIRTSQVPVITNNPPAPLVTNPNMPLTITSEVPKTTKSPIPLGTNSQIPIAQVPHAFVATPANVPVSQGPNIQIKTHRNRKERALEYDDDDDDYSDDYSDYESDHDKNKMYQGYYDHRDYYDKDEDYVYYVTKDGNRYKHYR